jgi:hypothetical protein
MAYSDIINLIFYALMCFLAFGEMAVLFASVAGIMLWLLRSVVRFLMG